jgi:hypothetical protein
MSIFVNTASSYQQMQNWRAGQAKINDQILGSPTALSTVDLSSAFAKAADDFYSGQVALGATAMGARISHEHQLAAAKTSGQTTPGAGLRAAQAAGNLILSNLGIAGASAGAASSGQSNSGHYSAPINAATGYSYVQTSAANVGILDAINIFA